MKKILFILFILFTCTIIAQGQKKDSLDIFVGKVNGYSVVYDCHDCRQSISGGITVSYKRNKIKRRMLDQVISDFYVDEVSLVKIKGEDFIYIGSTHTYGHSQGYLYYLHTATMKAYPVKVNKGGFKRPDTIQVRKYFDLTKDSKNNLGFGATLWTKSGRQGYLDGSYTLKKIRPNQYILVPSKPGLSLDEVE